MVKKARRNKAVVLTTHSMEEAEALCDRLGIFVGGRLHCLGNPKVPGRGEGAGAAWGPGGCGWPPHEEGAMQELPSRAAWQWRAGAPAPQAPCTLLFMLSLSQGHNPRTLPRPQDLTARFGGYLSFTITTPPQQEAAALRVVHSMAPGARLVYALGGTQKFEVPLGEVGVDAVFRRMEEAKLRWGSPLERQARVFVAVEAF